MKGTVVRGSRVGSSPMSLAKEIGEPAARVQQDYFCPQGHDFTRTFAAEAEVPSVWECPKCSTMAPTHPDGEAPVPESTKLGGKTHMEQLMGRRTRQELESLLEEALHNLRTTGRSFPQAS